MRVVMVLSRGLRYTTPKGATWEVLGMGVGLRCMTHILDLHFSVPKDLDHMSYGLNLGWGGTIGDYTGFWGNLLRDMLQI